MSQHSKSCCSFKGFCLLYRKLFKWTIHSLPAPMRYFLSLIAFWPTAALNRFICWFWPHKRRVWDRVSPHVILGAAPFLRSEIEHLYHQEGVRGVVNLCKEWDWHKMWYPTIGIRQLCLPTIDFDIPMLDHCIAGAQFIREHELRNESVYVHCKAGKGRSTTIVLCYLVMFRGMTPLEADQLVRRVRPQISHRYRADVVLRCAALGEQMGREGGSGNNLKAGAIPVAEAALAHENAIGRVVEPVVSHAQADKGTKWE